MCCDPLQLYSGGSLGGLPPTHLGLFLLDELQHLMREPIVLGTCIRENIDERTRK